MCGHGDDGYLFLSILFKYESSVGHLFVVCCDRVRQITLGNVVWSVMFFSLSMILYSNLFTSSRYVFRPKEEIDSFFLTHTGGALTNAGIGNLMTKEYRETSMQWPSGGCCCCLPTPMTLASGGSPMFPHVVHQPASPSIWPAVQSLRRGLSTNPGVTMWCVCGCS